MVSLFYAGCIQPVGMPNTPPPMVDPTTPFPCGAFRSVPLHCTSDLGERDYKFDLLVYCDERGVPERVITAQSADTPTMFELGATCTMNTDTWMINEDASAANIDCTDSWGDGSRTRYTFDLRFTANTDDIHGSIYFESIYTDATRTYEPGYSDCTF